MFGKHSLNVRLGDISFESGIVFNHFSKGYACPSHEKSRGVLRRWTMLSREISFHGDHISAKSNLELKNVTSMVRRKSPGMKANYCCIGSNLLSFWRLFQFLDEQISIHAL